MPETGERLAPRYRCLEEGDWKGTLWTVIQHWPGTFGYGVMLEHPEKGRLSVHSSMLVAPDWEPVWD